MIFIALTGPLPYRIMPVVLWVTPYLGNCVAKHMIFSDFGYYILLCLIWAVIFAIFWAICGYIIFRVVDQKLRACPGCRRKAAGIITDTEIEQLDMQVDHSGKESMRVKSEKVTDHYECKHCGHAWMRTYERKERTPIK